MQTCRGDEHVVKVLARDAKGFQFSEHFTSSERTDAEGTLSPRFRAEIARIAGERNHAHVVKLEIDCSR